MTAEAESSNMHKNNTKWHQDVHSIQKQKSHSPVKHTESPRKKAEQDSRTRVNPTVWTCGECLQWFPERDSYVSHVKTTHRKVRDHEFPMHKCVCLTKIIMTLLTFWFTNNIKYTISVKWSATISISSTYKITIWFRVPEQKTETTVF